MVNKTTKCAADCEQGDGSPADTEAYARCQASCISSFFFTGTATLPAQTASGVPTNNASATGTLTTVPTGDSTVVPTGKFNALVFGAKLGGPSC